MSESTRIKDLPPSERPRERMVLVGAENLGDVELIAILLRTGTRGHSALEAARALRSRYQNLDELARAPLEELVRFKGIGRDKAVTLKSAFTLAARMAREMRHEAPLVDNPERAADLLREDVRFYDVEHFHVVLLNTRRRLISIEKISQGTLDTAIIHPREVFRPAIQAASSAIIMVHNHPSGDPSPSEADIRITRDLIRAGQLLKIEVVDHIILGRATTERPKDYVSLRELGYFYS